jgi:hypothetical protein
MTTVSASQQSSFVALLTTVYMDSPVSPRQVSTDSPIQNVAVKARESFEQAVELLE